MYGNSGRNDMPSLHFKNTPVCWDFLALMFDFFSLSSCCVVRAWHSNLFSKSKSLCRRLPCLPCINYVDIVALTSDLLTVQFLDVWHFEWGNISTTFQVKIRPMCRRLSVVAQRCDANLFRKTLARYGARPLFTRSDPTDRQTDRQTLQCVVRPPTGGHLLNCRKDIGLLYATGEARYAAGMLHSAHTWFVQRKWLINAGMSDHVHQTAMRIPHSTRQCYSCRLRKAVMRC